MQKIFFQLKVTLKGVKPSVWRRIRVYDDVCMEEFHDILQATMGWTNSHLHSFIVRGKEYVPELDEDSEEYGAISYEGMELRDLLRVEAQKIIYLYDFGDNWEHEILLEKILPVEAGRDLPECVAGKGCCPPEDCGGAMEYMRMMEVLKDPQCPEYPKYKEWLEEERGTCKFSVEEVNERLEIAGDDTGSGMLDLFQKMIDGKIDTSIQQQVVYQKREREYPVGLCLLHPEVLALRGTDSDIDREILHRILALPRRSLCRDLEQLILFAIGKYYREKETLRENPDSDPDSFVIQHALFLLGELRAEESLPVILDVLRQEPEFEDYYFGDTLPGMIELTLYYTGRNRTNDLLEFMKEPSLNTWSRSEVSATMSLIALFEKDRRKEVLAWFRTLLSWFAEHLDDDTIIDGALNGLMISDIMDIAGVELLPEIKRLFDLNIVDWTICGDYEELENEIADGKPWKRERLMTIDERYDDYIAQWNGEQEDEDEYEDEYEDEDFWLPEDNKQKPFVNPLAKIGRNDPCPCGSGKKYKKCCGKD